MSWPSGYSGGSRVTVVSPVMSDTDHLPLEFDMILVKHETELRHEQALLVEFGDCEPRSMIPRIVLLVLELRPPRIGHGAGVGAPAGAVQIGVGADFRAVPVAGEDVPTTTEDVVVDGMDATGPTVLDHRVAVDGDRPARLPIGEMILKMDAMDLGELRRHGRQSRLETGIMIAERPEAACLGRRVHDLGQTFLRRLDLLNDRGAAFPADGGMARYTGAVHHVAVHDDRDRLQVFAELDEGAEGRRHDAGPEMSIRPDDDDAVFDGEFHAPREHRSRPRGAPVGDRDALPGALLDPFSTFVD